MMTTDYHHIFHGRLDHVIQIVDQFVDQDGLSDNLTPITLPDNTSLPSVHAERTQEGNPSSVDLVLTTLAQAWA